jgi:hypothetical protein
MVVSLQHPLKPDSIIDVSAPPFQRGRAGLRLMLDAYSYSQRLDRSPWDFAEEIASLRQGGLTNGDLRWLLCVGLVKHGHEISETHEHERRFQETAGLHFSDRTCFVLTELGATYLHKYLTPSELNGHSQALKPTWDSSLQELRLGKELVKQFKVPAPNQEMVLAVFQEEDWPAYIDDPLSPHSEIDPRRRLHDTINSLNRNQKMNLIQFRGNGSGTGIRWEVVNPSDT